jgi:aminoglycoside/choline kinase family phosphotransferase
MDALLIKSLNTYTNLNDFEILKLKGDASNREYFRETKNGFILCHYHKDQTGFKNFMDIQSLLSKNNIKNPNIFYSNFPILIQEDLGDLCLHDQVTEKNYERALDMLCDFQKMDTDFSFKASEAHFTKEKFMWELNFAQEHLKNLTSQKDTLNISSEFESLCDFILKDEQSPCHRDFHSKNLMLSKNELYLIDFQDARLGPKLYDLVSLVEDPYVDLKSDLKEKLKTRYAETTQGLLDEELYKKTALQRLFKACGSFAAQFNEKNNSDYLKYLDVAFNSLKVFLKDSPFPNLTHFVNDTSKLWTNHENR